MLAQQASQVLALSLQPFQLREVRRRLLLLQTTKDAMSARVFMFHRVLWGLQPVWLRAERRLLLSVALLTALPLID